MHGNDVEISGNDVGTYGEDENRMKKI